MYEVGLDATVNHTCTFVTNSYICIMYLSWFWIALCLHSMFWMDLVNCMLISNLNDCFSQFLWKLWLTPNRIVAEKAPSAASNPFVGTLCHLPFNRKFSWICASIPWIYYPVQTRKKLQVVVIIVVALIKFDIDVRTPTKFRLATYLPVHTQWKLSLLLNMITT